MSACVKWAKEHVDTFNVLLQRQMSSVDPNSPVWKECMDQAREHTTTLREVGLDFSELLGRGLTEPVAESKPVGLGLSS